MKKSEILKEVNAELNKILDNRKKALSLEISGFISDIHDNTYNEEVILQERLDELLCVKSLIAHTVAKLINSELVKEQDEMP